MPIVHAQLLMMMVFAAWSDSTIYQNVFTANLSDRNRRFVEDLPFG